MYFDENDGIGILIGTPESFQIGEVKKFDYEVVCISDNIEFITSSSDQINVTDENGNDVTSYLWWYRPGTYSITVEAHYQCPAIRNDNKQPTNLVAVAQPASSAEAPSNLDAVDRDDLLASIQTDANPLGLDAHSTSSLPTPTNLEAKALLDSPSNLKATYLAVGPKNLTAVSDGTSTPIPPVENLDALASPTGVTNLDALASPSEGVTDLDVGVEIVGVSNLDALVSPSTSVTNLDPLASPSSGATNLDALESPSVGVSDLEAELELAGVTNLNTLISPTESITNLNAQIALPSYTPTEFFDAFPGIVALCMSGRSAELPNRGSFNSFVYQWHNFIDFNGNPGALIPNKWWVYSGNPNANDPTGMLEVIAGSTWNAYTIDYNAADGTYTKTSQATDLGHITIPDPRDNTGIAATSGGFDSWTPAYYFCDSAMNGGPLDGMGSFNWGWQPAPATFSPPSQLQTLTLSEFMALYGTSQFVAIHLSVSTSYQSLSNLYSQSYNLTHSSATLSYRYFLRKPSDPDGTGAIIEQETQYGTWKARLVENFQNYDNFDYTSEPVDIGILHPSGSGFTDMPISHYWTNCNTGGNNCHVSAFANYDAL